MRRVGSIRPRFVRKLRATDGHAKNFSLFLLPGGDYRLAPLYDVLSAWPVIGRGANRIPPQKVRMAMAWLGKQRHYAASTVQRRHRGGGDSVLTSDP